MKMLRFVGGWGAVAAILLKFALSVPTPKLKVSDFLPDRHRRGLIAYDTLALDLYNCVGGSQINGKIFRKPAKN